MTTPPAKAKRFQFTLRRMLYATVWFAVAAWSIAFSNSHWMYGVWLFYSVAFVVAGIRAIVGRPASDARGIAKRQKWINWCAFLATALQLYAWSDVLALPPLTRCRPMGGAMGSLLALSLAAACLVRSSDQVVATWPRPVKGVIGLALSFVPMAVHVFIMWWIVDKLGLIFEA